MPETPHPLLRTLADRVRRLRQEHGFTREQLARRSGLSARFLAQVEAADGNISVVRLAQLAAALGTTADRILEPPPSTSVITLVGLRGAGKSSVGPLLSARLGVAFVEMDSRILEASGLPLDQLFELHGERYYRTVERETVRHLLAEDRPIVLAAAGGVVNEPTTWELLRDRTTVVWLRARAEDHWNRVVAQGDRRPMADNPAAMDELRAMLRTREPGYARAHLTVDTSDRTVEDVVDAIVEALPEGCLPEAQS